MANAVSVSFEFFPPGDEAGERQLWDAVRRLAPLRPDYVTVTYGADGATRSKTHACVARLRRETDLRIAPHLTCVGATREEVLSMAQDYWRHGIRHLVALRGDFPDVAGAPQAAAGFTYAADLVRGLKQTANFDIAVAAYPEGHPETVTVEADLDNLQRKIDAGANRAITQFCFDTDAILRYRDRCAARAMPVKIVPGILPITRFAQVARFAARCGATIPEWLRQRFDGLDDDVDTRRLIAAHVAIEQVQRLQRQGLDEFHFYTLNRADLTYAICHAIGLRPRVEDSAQESAQAACSAQVA
jgi:methylenetetrahydrofolate reductase (NADPH)